METELKKALFILNTGGVILYPSDTIWGLGCDATNSNAIEKIYKIKKRATNKSFISLVSNKQHLLRHTSINIKEAMRKKPTTIIYPEAIGLAPNIVGANNSAAIRIVQDLFCKKLIQLFDKPIVSTSANISTEKTPTKFSEITDEIKKNVDYIVNLRQNELMANPSTILMINKDGSIKKIRK